MTGNGTITLRGRDVTHRHPNVKKYEPSLVFFDRQDGTLFCDGEGKVFALGNPATQEDGKEITFQELRRLSAGAIRIAVMSRPGVGARFVGLLQRALGRIKD